MTQRSTVTAGVSNERKTPPSGCESSSRVQTGYLYVSIAHVVFVSLQGQVSVFLADEANKGFSIPPPLSVKAKCNPPSVQHNRQVIAEDRDRRQQQGRW